MRAVLVLLALLVAAPAHAETAGDRLIHWYGKKAHWKQVKKDVLRWHKTTRNGCVAFVSSALRRIGEDVPLDAEVDGERVSRLTRPFSLWLEDHLGWTRIDDPDDLQPGDIVFTEQAEYPWHVFVFHSWKDRDARRARILDNQGFLKVRPLDGADDIEPFAYALRAP